MKIRHIALLGFVGAAAMLQGPACSGPSAPESTLKFYVGSSDASIAHGVFLCEYNPQQGTLSVLDSFPGASGPSYLDFSPDHTRLYAIDKNMAGSAGNSMQVTAFRVDAGSNRLTYLNSQPSEGMGPCHIHCDPEGAFLFTANYNSGNVAAFPLDADGRILPASSVMQSEGSGPVEGRQEGPHTHDPEQGILTSLNPLSTVKSSHQGSKYPAAFRIAPDCRFVYASTRGNEQSCITVYRVESDGSLSVIEVVEGVPGWPRDFNIDPSGRYLLAAGERGGFIEVYKLDTNTGRLSPTETTLELPSPGCILFIPEKSES